jgi:hypothetical protein
MPRGQDTRFHQGRQVSRGFKPYGYAGFMAENTVSTGNWDMTKQMSDSYQPVNVGAVKASSGGYHPSVEAPLGGPLNMVASSTDTNSTHKTKFGARRAAKKLVKKGESPEVYDA